MMGAFFSYSTMGVFLNRSKNSTHLVFERLYLPIVPHYGVLTKKVTNMCVTSCEADPENEDKIPEFIRVTKNLDPRQNG